MAIELAVEVTSALAVNVSSAVESNSIWLAEITVPSIVPMPDAVIRMRSAVLRCRIVNSRPAAPYRLMSPSASATMPPFRLVPTFSALPTAPIAPLSAASVTLEPRMLMS